jgi:hypothetical protein
VLLSYRSAFTLNEGSPPPAATSGGGASTSDAGNK